MLQFDLQFYEELTVARVSTVKFISGAFFGRQVSLLCFLYLQVTDDCGEEFSFSQTVRILELVHPEYPQNGQVNHCFY